MKQKLLKMMPALFLLLFCSAAVSAQNVKVSGKITDEAGAPLPGTSADVQNSWN